MNNIYQLPVFEAISIDRKMNSGRTGALLMQCERFSAEGERYQQSLVVKCIANPNMYVGKRGLVNEAFCGLLAQHFGLRVPQPCIVQLNADLAFVAPDPRSAAIIRDSAGLNFGSRYLTGVSSFVSLSELHIQQAVNIFAFDMLIHNVDRRIDNANLFDSKDGLIIYDHELALPYGAPETLLSFKWDPCDFSQANYKNHVLYAKLKGKPTLKTDEFIQNLTSLSDLRLDAIIAEIPTEWQGNEMKHILRFLRQARDNRLKFENTLQGVLT